MALQSKDILHNYTNYGVSQKAFIIIIIEKITILKLKYCKQIF